NAASVVALALAGCGGNSACPARDAALAADDANPSGAEAGVDTGSDGAPGDGGGGAPAAPHCAPADAPRVGTPSGASACNGEISEFTAARPMGVGFPDGDDLLPPHVAYLTFDDGPSDWTGEVLDILATESVKATFFVNARNLKGAAGLDGSYVD